MEVQLLLFPVDSCLFPPTLCHSRCVHCTDVPGWGSNPFLLNHSGKKSVVMTRP